MHVCISRRGAASHSPTVPTILLEVWHLEPFLAPSHQKLLFLNPTPSTESLGCEHVELLLSEINLRTPSRAHSRNP